MARQLSATLGPDNLATVYSSLFSLPPGETVLYSAAWNAADHELVVFEQSENPASFWKPIASATINSSSDNFSGRYKNEGKNRVFLRFRSTELEGSSDSAVDVLVTLVGDEAFFEEGNDSPDQPVFGFGEKEHVELAPSPLSGDGAYSGITEIATSDGVCAFGDLLYLKASNGFWAKADATATGTAGAVELALCLRTGLAGSQIRILRYGKVNAAAKFPTMTASAPIFVSATAGLVTGTAPSTTDYVIRIVGHAINADELMFNPSNDYMTAV